MNSEPNDVCVTDLGQAATAFAAEVSGRADRKKKTLAGPSGLQMFLLYIRANGSVPEHQVAGPITVQTLLGSAQFTVNGKSYELPVGSAISVAAGLPHALLAHEESVLLVTHVLHD